ncbi:MULTISPECIES: restriction endonuclease subunit S [unclassified Microcystis]|jgi:type I restriction enzyme S subunit|uniref:restriction endonuclease subunit S n=1 Tax=unclassified Microcystis TaxID=2643300 RepID=UPI00258FD654|nr:MULTISPECIES: restriction endonuclease subunit S [unclassified Microcystis]MCE2661687.1 restriction endonuclease subunit S [Microcystis sp. 53602_E8]MDJ0526579.1 restriction endonuclease subunit S [Microcystis sp. M53600_WE12]MDJ0537564.1 restriction endonuclease subunit S [Microcystis sp. M53603_WE2]MDJ0604612.1 restriction endonuclease subunit S [Microcystis sp. M53602_WE12]
MTWRETTLGAGIHIKHGYAFKSEFFVNSGKYIVLTPGNFYEEGGFRLRAEKDRAYSGSIPENFILSKGDIIIAMTEQDAGLLGSSALIPENDRFLHNQRLGLIDKIDEELFNKNFLYYLFNTYSIRGQISGSASGTKVRHTSPDKIYRVKIKIPDVTTQQKIADILSKYDDLIENNRRRIELLERSARLLYKEWFVRLRFPGHEHTPIIDGIPEGWEKVRLKDIADLTMGQSPESEYYNEDRSGLPFHQGVTNFGIRFPENKVYCAKITRIANEGDILFSVRAPVGRMNISLEKIIIGRGLAAIRAKHNYQGFLYYHLKNYFFKEDMIGSGVIFASVTKAGLENVQLIKPKDSILAIFLDKTISIDEQIKILFRQNQKLKQARDILLPKLMNGEIEV